MKKGALGGAALGARARPSAAEQTAERIVALTGTLGVRRTELERFEAERESVTSRRRGVPLGSRSAAGAATGSPRARRRRADRARALAALRRGARRDRAARRASSEHRPLGALAGHRVGRWPTVVPPLAEIHAHRSAVALAYSAMRQTSFSAARKPSAASAEEALGLSAGSTPVLGGELVGSRPTPARITARSRRARF